KLMRNADIEPLRQAVTARRAVLQRGSAALREIELWRNRLLTSDEAIGAWIARHPASDTPEFRGLVRDARRDRQHRAFRALFRAIKAELDRQAIHTSEPSPPSTE